MAKVIAKVDLRVPNTPKGLRFIDDLRKYANRDRWSEIAARPRGGGKQNRSRSGDMKRETARYFGIYFRKSNAMIRQQFDAEAVVSLPRWRHEQILNQLSEAAKDDLSAEITGHTIAYNKLSHDLGRQLEEVEKRRVFWNTMTPLAFLLGIAASGLVAFFWQVQS
jgi:hypothetical protein